MKFKNNPPRGQGLNREYKIHDSIPDPNDFNRLALEIKQLGKEIGFDQVGITDIDLNQETKYLKNWLKSGFHGEMDYLERNINLREHPDQLLPDTVRVICCSINYPKHKSQHIASYAQNQDYSQHIRRLLKNFVAKIAEKTGISQKTRVFSGSAPILEKPLAIKSGIGWCGKNTIVTNDKGSYFLLGEIFTDLPLPIDKPTPNRCGNCTKCIDACPTKAIVAPHQLDPRKCISYLTIEYKDAIPLNLRQLMGTRIFGCDACLESCPWNRFAKNKSEIFTPLEHFASGNLVEWFLWDEKEFLEKTKNSPIRRIGYERWLRNIAIALGNSKPTEKNRKALQARLNYPSDLVHGHVKWSLT